jgi:tetratricopeptide (TPR) repeat protein
MGTLAMACASSTAVTRSVGGRLVRGRFVTDDAYAAYLRGALLEAQGKREAALGAYLEGVKRDPDSPELLTRIGALRCGDDGVAPAGGAFDRAATVDPTYEEAWTEQARCHLKRGRLADAEDAARVAVSLDPNRIEPALLLAAILEQQKRNEEAAHWLDGLVAREPQSVEVYEAWLAFAERTNDEARRGAARRALATFGARAEQRPFEQRVRPGLRDVDDALARGAFDEARRLALAARISSGALALRAAAIGAATFARDQAELVLAADPADGDARIAATVAADLLRDDAALGRAMSDAYAARTPLTPLAGALMAELLDRRIGADAKKAWLDALGAPPRDEGDQLLRDVTTRR